MFDYNKPIPDSNLLHTVPMLRNLATGPLAELCAPLFTTPLRPLAAILLDKSTVNNWQLDWHQDLKIAVKRQIEVPGFNNWTVEAGIPHVVPPLAILEQMLALRLHLDDCDETNGALEVMPGSHRLGIDNRADFQLPALSCPVSSGGIMLMSPLLQHRSSYSTSGKPRRVIHIVYSAAALPGGLEWQD